MPPHPGLSLSWRADGGPRLPPPTPRDDVDMPLHVALAEYSLPGARAEQWLEKSAVLPRAVTPTAVKNSCVLR